MKCLLCAYLAIKDDLMKHYINCHRVDTQNYFFKYLFLTNNKSLCIECCRCNEFLTTKENQRQHNFLEHYDEGKKLPFAEKPIEIKTIEGLTTYEISYEKHSDYYDFTASESVVDEFLFNVKNRFKSVGEDVSIKCGFSVENIQPAPTPYTVAMVNSRYWSTDVYKTTYFNDYVMSNLSNDIKKGVIANCLSGSSWRFSKLLYLNLKVLRSSSQLRR